MPATSRNLVATAIALAAAYVANAAFTISGSLPESKPGSVLILFRDDLDKRTNVQAGEIVVQPDRTFERRFDIEPGLFTLEFPDAGTLALAIATEQHVRIDRTSNRISVSGSPDTLALQAYDAFRRESLERLVYPPRSDFQRESARGGSPESLSKLSRLETAGYEAHRRELNDFTIEKIGASIALYATSLRWDGDYRLGELRKSVDEFERLHPGLDIVRSMKERIQTFEQTAIGSPGSIISGKSSDGKFHSVADYRGKVLLVDFWASWCPPCRIENSHYKSLKSTYSKSGFEIFAINLDEELSSWKNASKRDGVDWPQISDQLGWNSPLASAYSVTALPMNFLLDRNGIIIGKNLRGPELAKKLEVLLPQKR